MSASHDDSEEDSGGHSGGHDHGRWAVPYGDMLTVLMALFIVLYAMSSVDEAKYDQLAASLTDGFNSSVETAEETDLKGPEEEAEPATPMEEAVEELTEMAALKDAVEADLASKNLAGSVEYLIDDRGLTFKLLGTDTFFESNSDVLSGRANQIISAINPHLVSLPNEISVEGHADIRKPSSPWDTNWDLASARATTVLRFITETGGVPGSRLSSTSFGDAHPQVEGGGVEALAANRRVDVVVASQASDAAKALLPKLVNGEAGGTEKPTETQTIEKKKITEDSSGH
jgi:chemotaxis protein MotB